MLSCSVEFDNNKLLINIKFYTFLFNRNCTLIFHVKEVWTQY